MLNKNYNNSIIRYTQFIIIFTLFYFLFYQIGLRDIWAESYLEILNKGKSLGFEAVFDRNWAGYFYIVPNLSSALYCFFDKNGTYIFYFYRFVSFSSLLFAFYLIYKNINNRYYLFFIFIIGSFITFSHQSVFSIININTYYNAILFFLIVHIYLIDKDINLSRMEFFLILIFLSTKPSLVHVLMSIFLFKRYKKFSIILFFMSIIQIYLIFTTMIKEHAHFNLIENIIKSYYILNATFAKVYFGFFSEFSLLFSTIFLPIFIFYIIYLLIVNKKIIYIFLILTSFALGIYPMLTIINMDKFFIDNLLNTFNSYQKLQYNMVINLIWLFLVTPVVIFYERKSILRIIITGLVILSALFSINSSFDYRANPTNEQFVESIKHNEKFCMSTAPYPQWGNGSNWTYSNTDCTSNSDYILKKYDFSKINYFEFEIESNFDSIASLLINIQNNRTCEAYIKLYEDNTKKSYIMNRKLSDETNYIQFNLNDLPALNSYRFKLEIMSKNNECGIIQMYNKDNQYVVNPIFFKR